MKHTYTLAEGANVDVNVKVELPIEGLKDLTTHVADAAIGMMGMYMVANTVRHILKKLA